MNRPRSSPTTVPLPSPVLLTAVLLLYALFVAFWIAVAHAQDLNPAVVGYLSGGVGSDEVERMKARENDFDPPKASQRD